MNEPIIEYDGLTNRALVISSEVACRPVVPRVRGEGLEKSLILFRTSPNTVGDLSTALHFVSLRSR